MNRKKNSYTEVYTILQDLNEEEYNKFLIDLDSLDEVISRYNISDDILREYYYEVVLPMKYDDNVMKVINKNFSLYLPDIESGKGR